LEFMRKHADEMGVKIRGYCLMTNHVHLILEPSDEDGLSWTMRETHKLYTRRINFRHGVRGHLFQSRFFSCPLDDRHYIATMIYVERNPVRAKMCRNAWDHPWSSARFHVGMRKNDPLVDNRFAIPGIAEYKKMLSTDPDEIEVVRQKTRTGRPCGSNRFIAKAEFLTGRKFFPKPAGRPKSED